MCLLNLKMTCQSAHYRRRAYPTGRPSVQFPEIKYTHRGHAKSLCTTECRTSLVATNAAK